MPANRHATRSPRCTPATPSSWHRRSSGLILESRVRARHPLAGLCFLYPAAQSLAVVYTGNHYVVDIAIGFAFAWAAYALTKRAFRIGAA